MDYEQDDFDPWSLEALGHRRNLDDGSLLCIETISGIEPLDSQFQTQEIQAVPAGLYDPLFGHPIPATAGASTEGNQLENALPMQTYAVLDAAKVANLAVMLETTGLKCRCLFKGQAYDDLKDVAPWIVQLDETNKFTRHLFTKGNAPWHLWDKEPGIYIRSSGSLDDVWKHLRKFTRVQDTRGKWYYFRYWEPDIAQVHFAHISTLEEVWQHWFYGNNHCQIGSYVVVRKGGSTQVFYAPQGTSPRRTRRFHMSDDEVEKFRVWRSEQSQVDIADRLAKHAPERSFAELLSLVKKVAHRFSTLGFRSKSSLFSLSWYEIKYGPEFEKLLSPGAFKQLSIRSRDESLRIRDINFALKTHTRGS